MHGHLGARQFHSFQHPRPIIFGLEALQILKSKWISMIHSQVTDATPFSHNLFIQNPAWLHFLLIMGHQQY